MAWDRAVAPARDEAAGPPGDTAPVDPHLLGIEQKLDRMARQMSGLPTYDSLRTTMAVLAVLAVGAGLLGSVLIHP